MAFTVVLDTCVLYPAHLRDTLLRLAERGLYRVLWSQDIIDELQRNLIKESIDPAAVEHLTAEMEAAFPDSSVTGYQALINAMTCDPKDRHVLAAAVRADAAAIITFNNKDFSSHSVDPFQVDVIHPEAFLLDLLDLSPRFVIQELKEQAGANRREPKTLASLLDALATAGVASFADKVRRHTE